jgi:F-type H+-transporting ATPase subunit b
MGLLTPDPGLLFWMVLSFGVVFFLLAKFGFPVIVKALKDRQEFIAQSLLSAKQANERLESIQAEGEALLQNARSRQQDIISEAMAEKQKIVAAAKEQAESEAHRIAEEAAKSIEAAKTEALKDVHDEVAGLALQIAEQVLRTKMQDRDEQQAAIERILKEL